MLVNLGVAEKQEHKVIFNNTGIVFFPKNLQDIYFHTAVTCALYKGTEKIDVMVEIFDNRIEISNPGGLVKGLKPEYFGKKSVLRNPSIANLLHRIGYIEKMGTGINKMRSLIQEAKLPQINFEFDTFFTAIFQRPIASTASQISADKMKNFETKLSKALCNEGVKSRLKKEILYINTHETVRRPDIESKFNISTATAERDLSILKRRRLVVFKAASKTGGYVLTKKWKNIISGIESSK